MSSKGLVYADACRTDKESKGVHRAMGEQGTGLESNGDPPLIFLGAMAIYFIFALMMAPWKDITLFYPDKRRLGNHD